MRVLPFLYDPEVQARHPLLNSVGAAVGVLVLMPLALHWIAGESWAYSITVGVLCSSVVLFIVYRKLTPEKPQPPPPPWLQPPSNDE